jgi:hypothetical protein
MNSDPVPESNSQRRLQQSPKTYFIRFGDKVWLQFTEEPAFAELANAPTTDPQIAFQINDQCATKLQRAVGHLGDPSWPMQATNLARDLRCRILFLKEILAAGNITVESSFLVQLNIKLHEGHVKSLEMGDIVHMYCEVCEVLSEEILKGEVNKHDDLFGHALVLVPFEQFIALSIGRSPGPTPLNELIQVLITPITSFKGRVQATE